MRSSLRFSILDAFISSLNWNAESHRSIQPKWIITWVTPLFFPFGTVYRVLFTTWAQPCQLYSHIPNGRIYVRTCKTTSYCHMPHASCPCSLGSFVFFFSFHFIRHCQWGILCSRFREWNSFLSNDLLKFWFIKWAQSQWMKKKTKYNVIHCQSVVVVKVQFYLIFSFSPLLLNALKGKEWRKKEINMNHGTQ